MNAVLFGVIVYVFVQFIIGLLVSRYVSDEKDYLLAGRRLGLCLAMFTVFATWFGAETVVGAAGNMYAGGLSGDTAEPFAYALCLIFLGLFFAARLWRKQYVTFGDFFAQRYSSGVSRVFILLVVPAGVLWAAAQIRAFGHVVSVISDVDTSVAITIAAAVVIIYTAAGGMLATVVTDLVQGIALILGLVILFLAVLDHTGGFSAGLAMVPPERLDFFQAGDRSFWEIVEAWAIPICGATLAAEAVARILAAKSASTARHAAIFGGCLYFSVGLIPVYIGLVGPALVSELADPEQIVPIVAREYMTTVAYIMFTGALISAILSTVDSALLTAGGLISHNIVLPLRSAISDHGKLTIARLAVIMLGLVAYVLALQAEGVYDLIVTAVAFGTAGVFVCGVLGLYTSLGGRFAAYAALISGAVIWFTGEYILDWTTPYIISLGCALFAYLTAAFLEARINPMTAPANNH